MKQSNKDLPKVFFNSVEEMNECYGINARLPIGLYSNADLVCYEIVEPFVYEYLGQYTFTEVGFHHLNNLGEPVIHNHNEITYESDIVEDDLYKYEGRCFVYVRVNKYLRKHLEKTLIGCEFIYCRNKSETPYRRFVHSVEQEIMGFDELAYYDECSEASVEQIECVFRRVSKTKEDSKKTKTKSSRCKDTIDWVEVEYGDEYKKPKKVEVGY